MNVITYPRVKPDTDLDLDLVSLSKMGQVIPYYTFPGEWKVCTLDFAFNN